MIKTSDVVLAGLMMAATAWTFQVKYETKVSVGRVAELQKTIKSETDKIDLLTADWAVLSQPSRLQIMVERFGKELELQPLDIEQIVTLDDLPPIKLPDDPIGALARGDDFTDQLVTGSIGKVAQ